MDIENTLEKTVEDVLPKRGKLSQAIDGMLIDQMDQIGINEIDNVQRYMEQTVFKNNPKLESSSEGSEEMRRNFIVCDNITIGGSDQKEKQETSVKEQKQESTVPTSITSKEEPKKEKANLLPYAVAAASMLFGLGGLGVGAYSLLEPNEQPIVQQGTGIDTDSRYDIGFEGDFEVLKE
jgi:hypothetical protein